jgi:starch synthase
LDPAIARRYSVGTLAQKAQNKLALQEELSWAPEARTPLVCFPAGMTDALGGSLFREVLPGLLSLPIQIVVLGKGSAAYGSLFTQLSDSERHRIAILPEKEESIRKMYAAADMALFLSNPEKTPEVRNCLRYGVVPISLGCSLLEDYDPVQEAGNAFLYDSKSAWLCFAAVVRTLETYKFPFDWRTIQRHGMESVR